MVLLWVVSWNRRTMECSFMVLLGVFSWNQRTMECSFMAGGGVRPCTKVSSPEEEVKDLRRRLEGLDGEIAALVTELEELDQHIDLLHEYDIKDIGQTLLGHIGGGVRPCTKVSSPEEEVKDLRRRLEGLDGEIAALVT
ncbi:hypothetical protein NHX12_027819, partial [Muraenolepis orangiensis]